MKIEIIIPAYNCTKTLNRTLASLETQTDTDFSVHVIDDCSSEYLNPIVNKHCGLNIRLTRNEKNIGCGMSRQVGIDNTKADYIAFLDADDVLMPYTVEVWRNMLESSPHIDIFHSHIYEQRILDDSPALILHKYSFTHCHGKLYKVDFIKKHGIRNRPDVKYADDSFFNSLCSELGEMAVISIPMYIWLYNESSITRSSELFFKSCPYDFINAQLKAIDFLTDKGIKEIKHLPNTIKNLETTQHLFDEKTQKIFEELKEKIYLSNTEINK